eukprot:1853078-Rhodomonas_salina.2
MSGPSYRPTFRCLVLSTPYDYWPTPGLRVLVLRCIVPRLGQAQHFKNLLEPGPMRPSRLGGGEDGCPFRVHFHERRELRRVSKVLAPVIRAATARGAYGHEVRPIRLRACYSMSGISLRVSASALPTRCPVSAYARCDMSGTRLCVVLAVSGTIGLRVREAVSGTDAAYGATSFDASTETQEVFYQVLVVLRCTAKSKALRPQPRYSLYQQRGHNGFDCALYRPTRALRGVRYPGTDERRTRTTRRRRFTKTLLRRARPASNGHLRYLPTHMLCYVRYLPTHVLCYVRFLPTHVLCYVRYLPMRSLCYARSLPTHALCYVRYLPTHALRNVRYLPTQCPVLKLRAGGVTRACSTPSPRMR